MAFTTLFDVGTDEVAPVGAKTKKTRLSDLPRGCKSCPQNEAEGIQKIADEIEGRGILIVGQSPGPEENNDEDGASFVGKVSEFLWDELRSVGIKRKHCDLMYAVRCFPADVAEGSYKQYLKQRAPSKEEIHCCSKHTDKSFESVKAKQILVLGQVAAKALLKTRSLPAAKSFWSDELQARLYLVDHPSFFIKGYGKGPRMDQFRATLKRLSDDWQGVKQTDENLSDQFAYLREQNYQLVVNKKQAAAAWKDIIELSGNGKKRISVDIEDDEFEEGKRRIIGVGISPKIGTSYFFVINHPEIKPADGYDVLQVVTTLLTDETLHKAMQFGVSDVTKLWDLLSIVVQGYDHDTNLSEFLRFSDVRTYGLDAIAERRFPEFSGYKLIIVPEMMKAAAEKWQVDNPDKKLPAIFRSVPQAQEKWLSKNQEYHLRFCSLDTLRLYNGADCDLTKRIEVSNAKHVPPSLMELYVDLSFVLYEMQPNGPIFDYAQCDKLLTVFPFKAEALLARMREILKDDEFNPGSPDQVYDALYGTLDLEFPFEGKPNTRKGALLMLGREHEFPRLVNEWRSASKMDSTISGYKEIADSNAGRLLTKWWATGARTGRLSSGGSKDKNQKVTNLQNIKRDPQVRNLCVADPEWRAMYSYAISLLKPLAELQAYWVVCDEAKKKKQKPPKPSKLESQQFDWLARKLEKWVHKNAPGLKTYLIFDYGQVEVRVAAQMSGDENLIADCQSSDIHSLVGVQMTGWDIERIKYDEQVRTLTKNVHFGILFGLSKKNVYKYVLAMSPADMRDRISEEEIGNSYDRYFERYDGIRRFIERQREFAKANGYVKTIFGMVQTLNITDENSEDESLEYIDPDEVDQRSSWWGNQAVNGPVQGSAHQVMICALAQWRRKRKKFTLLGIPPMEVHDALYFAVPILQLNEAYSLGIQLLEQEPLKVIAEDFPDIGEWKVPIVVEGKAGLRLGCNVGVDEKTTVGAFLVDWVRKNRELERSLNKELKLALAA